MPEQIISASGAQFGLIVNAEGRALVDLGGDITISGVNLDSIVIKETTPIESNKNNPAWKFEYDTLNNLGSVTEFIGAGSFVNVLTWGGFSGTSIGIGSRVTNIGSFT